MPSLLVLLALVAGLDTLSSFARNQVATSPTETVTATTLVIFCVVRPDSYIRLYFPAERANFADIFQGYFDDLVFGLFSVLFSHMFPNCFVDVTSKVLT